MKIGLLHPGAMGSTIGACLVHNNHEVFVALNNRSKDSIERAEKYKLLNCENIENMCHLCEIIICICPPAFAMDVCNSVVNCKFNGLYVDANAINPATSMIIAEKINNSGRYVDGGIIGPPAIVANTTRLYLSGPEALQVAALFENTLCQAIPLSNDKSVVSASAMKLAYSSWTKGSSALLLSVLSFAKHHRLDNELLKEFNISQKYALQRSERLGFVAPKAWRFEGEMEEIAAAFSSANLPSGFHDSSAKIYRRLKHLKGALATDYKVNQMTDIIIIKKDEDEGEKI